MKPRAPRQPRPQRNVRAQGQKPQTPQAYNAARLAVLATQPQKRVKMPPASKLTIAAYARDLLPIVDRAYAIADRTVIHAVERQQALADGLDVADARLTTREKIKAFLAGQRAANKAIRAAAQNVPHTPEQKQELDLPPDVQAAIADMDRQIAAMVRQLSDPSFLVGISDRVLSETATANEAAMNSLALQVIEPKSQLAAAESVWLRNNASLIKSIPTELAERVREKVATMVPQGARWETIAKQLREEHGIGKNRAQLIARDQVGKYHADLAQTRMQACGINAYSWSGAQDNRERASHLALQGTVWTFDKPPPIGNPGTPIQCLPGDSPIRFAPFVTEAYRRWHSGDLASFVTSTGETIRATLNHPVLTTTGWKAAKDVNVGDDLVCQRREGGSVLNDYVQHGQATIEQVFDALAVIGLVMRQSPLAGDFHGDGSVDQDIDIVRLAWDLPIGVKPSDAQRIGQLLFTSADMCLPDVASCGVLLSVLRALGLPANSVVRGLCKCLAIFGAGSSHADEHRGAATTLLDSIAAQKFHDAEPLASKAVSQGLDAFASQVRGNDFRLGEWLGIGRWAVGLGVDETPIAEQLAQIVGIAPHGARSLSEGCSTFYQPLRVVEKTVGVFGGHVYNLTTSCGWYETDAIVHNCRCTASPVTSQVELSKASTITESQLHARMVAIGPRDDDPPDLSREALSARSTRELANEQKQAAEYKASRDV